MDYHLYMHCIILKYLHNIEIFSSKYQIFSIKISKYLKYQICIIKMTTWQCQGSFSQRRGVERKNLPAPFQLLECQLVRVGRWVHGWADLILWMEENPAGSIQSNHRKPPSSRTEKKYLFFNWRKHGLIFLVLANSPKAGCRSQSLLLDIVWISFEVYCSPSSWAIYQWGLHSPLP